jgi:hypothetical protein
VTAVTRTSNAGLARFLTEEQAADHLNLPKYELARRRRFGGGPPFVLWGVRVRYPLADLIEWEQSLPRFATMAEVYAADRRRADEAERRRASLAGVRNKKWSPKSVAGRKAAQSKRAGKLAKKLTGADAPI